MTIQEILKSQGLEDEQIEKIVGEMKQNKIFTASEENLDIRFGKLKTEHDGTKAELEKANGLIAELQKSAKGNEEMQGKISTYESEVEQLRAELERTKLESAIKVGLLSEHALDVDYLTYKLEHENGDSLKLDADGNVKGWADKLASLKTQFPTQFESKESSKKVEPNPLPDKEDPKSTGMTKAEMLKKPYAERLKMYQDNPQAYEDVMNGKEE